MKTKQKPCKWCGRDSHPAFMCFKNPKREAALIKANATPRKPLIANRKPLKQSGKRSKEWLAIRKAWFEKHSSYYYTCELRISKNCHRVMPKNETTLDHVIPKSNAKNYANRHDEDNLKPACYPCNGAKGSKH